MATTRRRSSPRTTRRQAAPVARRQQASRVQEPGTEKINRERSNRGSAQERGQERGQSRGQNAGRAQGRPVTSRQERGAGRKSTARRGARKAKKTEDGIIGYLKYLAIIIPIGLVLSFCNKAEDNADIKTEMLGLMELMPNYDQKKHYYIRLVNANHDTAFEASYREGGRRRGADFDAEKYMSMMKRAMAADARRDGEEEVAGYIEMLY